MDPIQPLLLQSPLSTVLAQISTIDLNLSRLQKHTATRDHSVRKSIDDLLDQRLVLMKRRDQMVPPTPPPKLPSTKRKATRRRVKEKPSP